jgi:hypothetical protein
MSLGFTGKSKARAESDAGEQATRSARAAMIGTPVHAAAAAAAPITGGRPHDCGSPVIASQLAGIKRAA